FHRSGTSPLVAKTVAVHKTWQDPDMSVLVANRLQLAWIISFISSVIAQVETKNQFPTFTWWTVVYYFFTIIGVFVVVASDTTQTYHVAVVGYLACGLILTTSSVNTL